MKSAKNISSDVWQIAEPIATSLGYFLWDVEYVKEGTEWFLRITIDSDNGINIEDCEAMSRALDPVLDEKDPIEDSYRLEVSSPGIERDIKTDFHLEKCKGEKVQIKLYAPIDNVKSFIGTLDGYDKDTVKILCEEEKIIPRKAIAKMNVYFEF